MRVAIDARMIEYTGIGRYIQNLISGLSRLGNGISVGVVCEGVPGGPVDLPGNVERFRPSFNIPVYSLKEHMLLPFEMRSTGADLFHYPSFNMPIVNSRPSVVTVHDLIYYLHPEACPGKAAHIYARFMFDVVVKRAGRIITVSEFSKKEIAGSLGVDPRKISVIHNGVGGLYRPVEDTERIAQVRKRYGITGDYIFYAGNHQPRKNLSRLISAFSALKNGKDRQLVLTGGVEPRRAALYASVKGLGLSGRVLFIGAVPEEDLPALYSGALLFAFPSLMEGFGLPPLEAFACGAPVVSSNASSIPEVVGDAALTFDPTDTGAMAVAIDRVLSSADLRQEMREKGLARAGRFTWEATARKTLKVYEEVLNA
ncbi:MAG: glycosyltransferase family 4 protein [Deltaproteobacteria bacterium]|nr:glycosyltransferase family 4 protein [Deltaproteobacteria bacterium]